MDWRTRGACVEIGGEAFFPFVQDLEQARYIKQVCRRCPVTGECLDWALGVARVEGEHPEGIWGGATVEEREAMQPAPGRRAA